jgi:hypothetical protein
VRVLITTLNCVFFFAFVTGLTQSSARRHGTSLLAYSDLIKLRRSKNCRVELFNILAKGTTLLQTLKDSAARGWRHPMMAAYASIYNFVYTFTPFQYCRSISIIVVTGRYFIPVGNPTKSFIVVNDGLRWH